MKRKPIIIVLSVLFSSVLLYCGVWFCYYQFVWMPHVRNAAQTLTAEKDDSKKETKYYVPKDELGDTYYISIPSFGSFNCYVSSYPSIVTDGSMPMVDENGNTTYATYIQNGCPFWCEMSACLGADGSVKEYQFDIKPYPAPADFESSPYAQSALLLVSADGKLLNETALSKKELAIYQDAHSEIVRLIDQTNSIFQLN